MRTQCELALALASPDQQRTSGSKRAARTKKRQSQREERRRFAVSTLSADLCVHRPCRHSSGFLRLLGFARGTMLSGRDSWAEPPSILLSASSAVSGASDSRSCFFPRWLRAGTPLLAIGQCPVCSGSNSLIRNDLRFENISRRHNSAWYKRHNPQDMVSRRLRHVFSLSLLIDRSKRSVRASTDAHFVRVHGCTDRIKADLFVKTDQG
jgi:hypothetical protein